MGTPNFSRQHPATNNPQAPALTQHPSLKGLYAITDERLLSGTRLFEAAEQALFANDSKRRRASKHFVSSTRHYC